MYRYYYEVVKVLKRQYNDHPEKCPFPDFGIDGSILLCVNSCVRFRKDCLPRVQERSEEEGARDPIAAEIFAQRLHEDSFQRSREGAPHLWLRGGSYKVLGQVP